MDKKGLTSKEAEESRQKYGSNALTQIPPEPLWKKILKGFKDPMIIILLVALAIQFILWIIGQAEWYEPVCILIAILIANGVSSVSENHQENKAQALKKETESKDIAKVLRDGKLCEVHVDDIVAGDIVYLMAGDKIPADGIVVDGKLKIDQSALNGETEEATKTACPDGAEYNIKDLLNPYYAYRGTVVVGGQGYIQIKVVGDKTLFGELSLEVQEETRQTPLQVKLAKLAKQISKFGYIGAIAIIVAIMGKHLLSGNIPTTFVGENGWLELILAAITTAVTIIVCAVPEGLPMLTSILLSFQSMKMAKDNVLVRKINGLETAGSVNLLFSDKTGTITEGKLSVVEFATGNVTRFKKLDEVHSILSIDIITGIGVNNSSTATDGKVIGGNPTDRALMAFLIDDNSNEKINKDEVRAFNAFDSAKKYSSVEIERDGKKIKYIKGAPEKIIDKCTKYVNEKGEVRDLVEKNYLLSYMNEQAGRSMRLIAVAKQIDGEDSPMILVCVISIRDNVRESAARAIKEVQNAGIQVVMITGDRKETAVAIAKDAGILKNSTDVALTSAELAEKSDEEVKKIIPNLRVVSRALPTDKSRLVRLAQELNYVVGMTGDGVNDSPALKKADVGFAMGSGTEVAKDAGDITILDDNFSSIGKAILYGRTMFKNIRKFLIFQLTINFAAVITCFIGPLFGFDTVLTVVQLLLINLAMDTLAAIAFGSEPALEEYMHDKPVPRNESIATKKMLSEIILGAVYITLICLSILFAPFVQNWIGISSDDDTGLRSALFATFMMAITFNGFNARTEHENVFGNLGKNKNFLVVMGVIFAMAVVFVTFGGKILEVEALSLRTWIVCAIMAFLIIPIDMIRKVITNSNKK